MTYGSDEGLYQTYDPNFDFSEVMKRLYQVQNRIASTVTRLGEAESKITQTADEIELKVSKNGVISAINQTAEEIKIQASKISLVGAVTVLSDITGELGTITAGILHGVEITSDSVINVGTDINIGNNMYLGDPSYMFATRNIYFNGTAYISYFDQVLSVNASSFNISASAYVHNQEIATQSWVQSQGYSTGSSGDPLNGYSLGTYKFQFPTAGWGGILKNLSSGMEIKNSTDSGYGTLYATDFIKASLREWKKNIEAYTANALDMIQATPVRTFNYNEEPDGMMKTVGFIADEVPLEMLDLAGRGVNFGGTIAIMFKGIQELTERVKALETAT